MPRYKRSVSEGIPKATPEGICPKCKGAGYLRADVPIGHPQFGKLANECLDRGMTVLFTTAPDLLDHLRATFAPLSTIAYDELFTSMREAELLVIDDLGAQYSTPWAVEKLFQLLNHRYINRLLTVITSNNDGLQTIDERIASRLGDTGLVRRIKMEQAEDYRPFTGGPKQTDASFK